LGGGEGQRGPHQSVQKIVGKFTDLENGGGENSGKNDDRKRNQKKKTAGRERGGRKKKGFKKESWNREYDRSGAVTSEKKVRSSKTEDVSAKGVRKTGTTGMRIRSLNPGEGGEGSVETKKNYLFWGFKGGQGHWKKKQKGFQSLGSLALKQDAH